MVAPKIKLHPVKRIGAGFHDDTFLSQFSSATAIREHANENLSSFMPDYASFQAAPKVQWSDYLLAQVSAAFCTSYDIFQVNEELAVRLKSAIQIATDFETSIWMQW